MKPLERHVGAALLAATAVGVTPSAPAAADSDHTAIRPFRVNVPDADLADMRRRLAATRWPDKETVSDQSQGAPLAKLQELVRYWATEYDWRKAEARLNAFPQFRTAIDGVDIHFIHVRSRHDNARPLIYFNQADRGGHFPAWEEPQLFAAELRAAFKSIR